MRNKMYRVLIASAVITMMLSIGPWTVYAADTPEDIADPITAEEGDEEFETDPREVVEAEEGEETEDTAELFVNTGAIIAGEETGVTFYIDFMKSPGSEIILYNKDDEEMGKLVDNGEGGDAMAGDLRYCYSANILSDEPGTNLVFYGKFGDYKSKPIEIPVLPPPTEEDYAIEDNLEKMILTIEAEYTDETGCVPEKLYPKLFTDIHNQMLPLLENGTLRYEEYSETTGVNVQLASGLWFFYTPAPYPEITQPEDPTGVEATRWRMMGGLNQKTVQMVISADTQRFEVFYYLGDEGNLTRPNIKLQAPDGALYSASEPVETENFTLRVVNQTKLKDFPNVYFDTIYISGPNIHGTWNMSLTVDPECQMIAILPSEVPGNWRNLTVEYRTTPLSDPILWMDDTYDQRFINQFMYIFAKDHNTPGVNDVEPTQKPDDTDYSGYVKLASLIAFLVVAGVSVAIYFRTKNTKEASKKRRDEDLESVLEADDYSDDDFYKDNADNDAYWDISEDSAADNNVNIAEERTGQEYSAPDSVQQTAQNPVQNNIPPSFVVDNSANAAPQNAAPQPAGFSVQENNQIQQKQSTPAPAQRPQRGFSPHSEPFTEKAEIDDYSDEAYENAKAELENQYKNSQAVEQARIDEQIRQKQAAEEEAARLQAIEAAKPQARKPMQEFNKDLPEWMRPSAPAKPATKGSQNGTTPTPVSFF